MAAVDIRTMVGSPERQRERKGIHPFFRGKPTRTQAKPHDPPAPPADLKPTETTQTADIIPKHHADLTLSSPIPAAITKVAQPALPSLAAQEADRIDDDGNKSRRKRRCITPCRSEDESPSVTSRPPSSQETALDLTLVKSRVSSRVDDGPSLKLTSQTPALPTQPLSFLTGPKESTAARPEPITHLNGTAPTSDAMAPTGKPVKMLNLNIKSGTIGSPPPKKLSIAAAKKAAKEEAAQKEAAEKDARKAEDAKANDEAPKKLRRSRNKAEKVEENEQVKEVPKSQIIRLPYGQKEERRMAVGYMIEDIWEAKIKVKVPVLPSMKKKKRARKPAAPPKTANIVEAEQNADAEVDEIQPLAAPVVTEPAKPKAPPKQAHPFFLGKAAIKPSAKADDNATGKLPSGASLRHTTPPRSQPKTRTTVTPKKPVRSAPQGIFVSSSTNNFAAFGTAAKMQRVPGAIEPAWPWQGMTHVRGEFHDLPMLLHDDTTTDFIPSQSRKSKYAAPIPAAGENILEALISRLNLDAVREELEEQAASNQNLPADKHLRIPNHYFESGVKIQRRIAPQVKASLSERVQIDDSEDELAKENPGLFPHFAISSLYAKIPTSLSAFDKSQSDTQTWPQKYAPSCAREVLQSGPDAQVLKSWLQTLTVDAVEGAVKKKDSPPSKKKKDEAAPKRKRKSQKLDGFVVDSDEEDNEMEEIDTFDDSPPGSQGGMKTVVRRGDTGKGSKEPTKLMNAVLLSGPNGCGKTAAIYAVAKELDFEVFEINSSTRRSGKDILEKVGDMTKNHLVQHKRQSSPSADDDLRRASEALDADLKSGRQGTMMSFFSKKPEPKVNETKPKITLKVKKEEMPPPPQLKPRVQQKQSLILLEEVDVLYEEDKEFWKTIIELAASSKRPVIMTCNDESLVPKQALPLHAIIRFAPPPIEMAVDYMLLVAANEGHVLHRHAVNQLYEAHQHDLRSSLTELEFWCQFGVGDRRGGYDWHIPRWPKGKDLDTHGRKLRVVSEGTYRAGMGMLGHDYLCSTNSITNAEDEMLKEAWDGWHLDAGDWHGSLKLGHWSNKAKVPAGKGNLVDVLEAYEDFTDAMSSADLCSHGFYGTEHDDALDTTSPPIFTKALDDNVLGSTSIKADMAHPQTALERDISISIKILARKTAQKHAAQYPNGAAISFQPITEKQVDRFIITSLNQEPDGITRHDFGTALDPIASTDTFAESSSSYFQASVIDRTTKIVALDVAPYVRGIVAYDAKLADERKKLSNLLSEGGRPERKKMRTTRAAMSALEGGERKSTRRERWFRDKANSILVAQTGLPEWQNALEHEMQLRKEKQKRDEEEAGVTVKKA